MKKQHTKSKGDVEFTTCPVCSCSLKASNLADHLKRVHQKEEPIGVEKSRSKKRSKATDNEQINKRELRSLQNMLAKQALHRNILCVALVALVMLMPFAYAASAPVAEVSAPAQMPTYLAPEPTTSSQPQPEPEFTLAPDFTGVDVITGDTVSLSQFSGTVVLLNFVNYGCDPSTNQVVSAQLLAIKNLTEQRDDFEPLSVFCGCCPEETLRNFATENELDWSWILDSDYSIIQLYMEQVKQYGYPTLIFINQDQYLVDYTGYLDVATLSAKIDETLES